MISGQAGILAAIVIYLLAMVYVDRSQWLQERQR